MIKKIGIVITFLGSFNIIFSLSKENKQKIGMLIWQNEGSCKVDRLTCWSKHESFLSLGIGHFIWYPEGQTPYYTEQFPALCNYLKKNGVPFPQWLEKAKDIGAPWQSRDEFLADNKRLDELQSLLASTIDLQTNFMIEELEKQWPHIIEAVSQSKKKQIIHYFMLMKTSLLGIYALVDYLNFKGSGLNPKEQKRGQGWGLLQVLLDLPEDLTENNINKAFTIAAAKRLLLLIENSSPEYKPIRYLNGWMKRISTYTKPAILD